jgi:hypothetical protein
MRSKQMKSLAVAAALLIGAAALPSGSAQAAGCMKGALVGGVAGHYIGNHGWLGAAAGCAIGRHEANKNQRNQQPAQRQTNANYR